MKIFYRKHSDFVEFFDAAMNPLFPRFNSIEGSDDCDVSLPAIGVYVGKWCRVLNSNEGFLVIENLQTEFIEL
jgi:hypothetical protein